MKKSVLALVLASFAVSAQPAAQENVIDKETQTSYNILLSQYATASLGFYIEQRCRQLAEQAYLDFAKNQQLINSFMLIMMGQEANTKLLVDIQENANNEELNPCDSSTFKFANQASTVASTLATRVRLLSEEEIARLNRAMTGGTSPAGQSQGQTEESPQPEAGQETIATTPAQGQAGTQPPTQPKTTFETLTPTHVERQPETKKPQPETTPEAEPGGATQPQARDTRETAQAAGIGIGDYVNPYPYSAPPPPPGETEKQMKRRQRQEIIDLRRAHRAEKDAFKDNEDNYADPDAVKDYIDDRQDDEFDAMRERHDRERDRY